MMNNFKSAMFQANLLYNLNINPDDFEEIGLIAWNLIGNKVVKTYRLTTKIDPKTLTVSLPCNADIIEAVTTLSEDWNYTTNYSDNGDIDTSIIELYIESDKQETNPLYIRGGYINYERVGDKLYFDRNYGTINILYKGVLVDEEGLPELTDKEVTAIATYVAYVSKYKEGLVTNNSNVINLAQSLEIKWNKQCDLARVADYINQNEMDAILNASTSWDRKRYNKSYKPIK